MRLLVLGAGYVGMAVLSGWENNDDTFIATTTTPSKLEQIEALSGVERAVLFETGGCLKAILQQCDGAIICVASGRGGDDEATYLGTAKTVAEALKGRERPFYLVYTSSTFVYGDQKGKIVDEQTSRNFQSDRSKILCATEDAYLSCANEYVTACVLRLGGIFGPDRTLESRTQWFSGKEFPGDGSEPTNHIHRDNVVRALLFCVNKNLSGVYNLVNDEHRTRKEFYGQLCERQKLPPPKWCPDLPAGEGSNCTVSNKKICDAGFSFLTPQGNRIINDF